MAVFLHNMRGWTMSVMSQSTRFYRDIHEICIMCCKSRAKTRDYISAGANKLCPGPKHCAPERHYLLNHTIFLRNFYTDVKTVRTVCFLSKHSCWFSVAVAQMLRCSLHVIWHTTRVLSWQTALQMRGYAYVRGLSDLCVEFCCFICVELQIMITALHV